MQTAYCHWVPLYDTHCASADNNETAQDNLMEDVYGIQRQAAAQCGPIHVYLFTYIATASLGLGKGSRFA